MEDYIDLVIAKLDEDHIVLRAPWNTVRAVIPCMCKAMETTRHWKSSQSGKPRL